MIQRTPKAHLPAALESAVQAALDDRREVLADPAVERALIERPEAVGPLLAWLETLASIEQVATSIPRRRVAGLAAATGLLAAAGLLWLATSISEPAPDDLPPHAPGPALAVHDYSITVTRTGPTGSTRLVNDNGRVALVGEWNPLALASIRELPPAVHDLRIHSSRKNRSR